MKRYVLLLPFFLFLGFPAICEITDVDSSITVTRQFDWQQGNLTMQMEAPVHYNEGTPANGIFATQQRIEDTFSRQLFNSLLTIQVDSRRNVGDYLRENPLLSERIIDLTTTAVRGLPRASSDLKSVMIEYRVPIFPELSSLFVIHRIPFYMPTVLEWVPTREFTGLVIYAAETMPLHGTNRRVLLEPALLPEIYDVTLRPVLEQDMLDPEYAIRWGGVAYTESPDEVPWVERIGNDPLRIMAREAFGVHPTDIIIGSDDADRLLSLQQNQQFLREGRILVILAAGQATAD